MFVTVSGTRFELGGRNFRAAGANCYYLPYEARTRMEATLDRLRELGLGVVRTWAFEGPLEALDAVVAAAARRGLRLILPLINNWHDYGGIDALLDRAGLRYHNEFFTAPAAIELYQAWMEQVVPRYRDEPAVMAWELANEPRWQGSRLPSSGQPDVTALVEWVRRMSARCKQLDRHHLVGAGDEGFYQRDGHGTDFDRFLSIETIDFGTVHFYPEKWRLPVDGAQWINRRLASGARSGKPVLLEEFGLRNQADRATRYTQWLARWEAGGGAGALVWMAAADGYPDYDGFTLSAPRDFAPLRAYAHGMPAAGVVSVSLFNAQGEILRQSGVQLLFRPVSGGIQQFARVDFRGEPVPVRLPAAGSPPRWYTCQVIAPGYRVGELGAFAVWPDRPTITTLVLPREPGAWRAEFGPVPAPLQEVLARSPALATLPDGLPKAALLNLYHRLSTLNEPVSAKRSWWSFVRELLRVDRERLIAHADPQLALLVGHILDNLAEFRQDYRPAENPQGHRRNFPEPQRSRITTLRSVKTTEAQGNLQLTVASGPDFTMLDADIDENGRALPHFFDLLKHLVTGGTHPFDVHELLWAKATAEGRRIDLGYRLV